MGAPKVSARESLTDLGFDLRVVAGPNAKELAHELEQSLGGWIQLEVAVGSRTTQAEAHGQTTTPHLYFVDANAPDLDERLAELAGDSSRHAVFLIVREGDEVPAALVEGRADDVLVRPFRALEVLSKLRQFQKLQSYHEAAQVNSAYEGVVHSLTEDLKLAERMQKLRLPRRFPEVRGFKVTSRYLAGERSGGDYVDLAETQDGHNMAVVMTDASSYRVSSAVLDAVTRRLANIPADEVRSCVTAARRIRDGVLGSMSERDRLSLFYGVVSRKDYSFRFVNLGATRAYYAAPGQEYAELTQGRGDPIVRALGVRGEDEGSLMLEPGGRLMLVSDGFVEAAGGSAEALRVLNQHREGEAADTLNEFVFRVKRKIKTEEELPPQDCTAVMFEVDSRVIRLTKRD